MRERLNILVHGEPKSGKTTFAVRRNPGVLIKDTEGSSKFIRGVKREVVTNMADMDAVLARIKSGEVTCVVIDTLDELVNNFAMKEAKAKGGQNVKGDGMLSQSGYGVLRARVLSLLRSYRDAGADVLCICHSEIEELPNGGKKWTMKLPSDYAREVMGMQDIIGFMEKHRGPDGNETRRLNLEKSAMFDAGYRAVYDATDDKFHYVVPPLIDDPALIDILKAYDDFFDGKTAGFVAKCSNCAKKGVDKDAAAEVDGKLFCADCKTKYEELKNANKE